MMRTSLRGLGPTGDNHHHAMWDAAYVLGSLCATDRRDFEAHIAGCPQCRQAVAELSGIPAMLSQLDRTDIAAINKADQPSAASEMPPELLPSLQAAVRSRRRRTRMMTWMGWAAAAVILTIGVLIGVHSSFLTSTPRQSTVSALPMDQVGTTLLSSTVSLSGEQWGTNIALKFVCMAPPDASHDTVALVVVGRDGSQTRLASWVAIPGHTATPTGSVSMPINQIAAVQVVLADNGHVMLQRSI